jgi:hypothetical protein
VLTTFGLCAGIPYHIWLWFLGFELIGILFYVFYGSKNSLLGKEEPEGILDRRVDSNFVGEEEIEMMRN